MLTLYDQDENKKVLSFMKPPDAMKNHIAPLTPDTLESLEVATINQNCLPKHKITTSVPHAKETKDFLPIIRSNNAHVTQGKLPNQKEPPASIECQWKDCDIEWKNDEIMDHIRTCHVNPQKRNETVECLWEECKVYNKLSCLQSWFERHILTHSGDKPFRCIVKDCRAHLTMQGSLEWHISSHINAQEPSPNQKHSKQSREDTPTKLLKRKRFKPI